jgi:lysophospholipase L1-like esterase
MSTPAETNGKTRSRGWLIALVVLVASLGLAEVAFRFLWERDELDPYSAAMRNARIEGHPYLAYANKPLYDTVTDLGQQLTHNSLGFRGPEVDWVKPEGTTRILCLGGSSTYGFGPSSDLATYPARLEHHLREAYPERDFEVVNMGCQGYSTHESLINLAFRGVDLNPDLVVVYHMINDVRCALYPKVQHDNTHWRVSWPTERPTPTQRKLERSFLYLAWRRYLTDWWTVRQNLGAYVIKDFGAYEDDFNQPDEGGLGFRNFQRNLVSIATLAQRHGSRVLFVTQGMDADDLGKAPSRSIQLKGMKKARDILAAVSADTGFPLIDAAPILEQAAKDGQEVFTHQVHLQDPGADLLARTIAAGIVGMKLIE